MPFAPRNARSITKSESMSGTQWSTVAKVRPRKRPPGTTNETVSLEHLQIAAHGFDGHVQLLRGAGHGDAALGPRTREQIAPTLVARDRLVVAMRQGDGCGGADRGRGLLVQSHAGIFAHFV